MTRSHVFALVFAMPVLCLGFGAAPGSKPGPLSIAAFADDDGGGGGRGGGGRGGGRGGRGGSGGDSDGGQRVRTGGAFVGQRASRPRPRMSRPARRPPPAPTFIAREIVVAGIQAPALDQLAATGFAVLARAPLSASTGEIARLRTPSGVDFDDARQRVQALAPEAAVDRNHLYRPEEFRCNPGGCAGAVAVAWPSCTAGPLIGIVDTRVDPTNPALQGQPIETVLLIENGRREADGGHGTAVAALIAGRLDSRTPGLLPNARLLAASTFFQDRNGAAADAFGVARGIDLVAGRRVDAANLSLAGPANEILERVVRTALEAGIPVVAAAGNGGPSAPPAYPAAYPGVIAVTAVDRRNRIFNRAGRGDHVAFAAPGVRLWTAAPGAAGKLQSGTSFAAPFVTAAVAAMRIRAPEEKPATHVEVLAGSAVDLGENGRDPVFGWGLVQAKTACG